MKVVTTAVIPGESDQDWASTHVTADGSLWGVCGDGHGAPVLSETRDFVQHCKDVDWANFFTQSTQDLDVPWHPGLALDELTDSWGICTVGIGACITIFRVGQAAIDVWSRGDTMAVLYVDDAQVWQSVRHSAKTITDDVANGRSVIPGWQVSILSPSRMTMVPDAHIKLNAHPAGHALSGISDECAVYNCLGHNKWAAGDWAHDTHTIDPTTKTTLVVGSDGVWDVLAEDEQQNISSFPGSSASKLAEFCAARWRQEWQYEWQGRIISPKQVIPNPDDVSCIVVSMTD